jgi:delta14-sterol reductase
LTLFIIALWTYKNGPGALLFIPHHWPQLISAALVMSWLQVRLPSSLLTSCTDSLLRMQAWFVFFQSYIGDQLLALGGNSRVPLYNVRSFLLPLSSFLWPFSYLQWFIGRSLNPRLGDFDIKCFNEMRPGLILWIVIDLSMMAWQYERIGRVTDSIVLTTAFHLWYVFDAEFNEVSIFPRLPFFRCWADSFSAT